MSQAHWFRLLVCATSVAMSLALVPVAQAQASSPTAPTPEEQIFWYTAPVPLGSDGFRLLPADKSFFLLACVEDERFDRLQVSRVRQSPFVIDNSGQLWKNYPDEMTFRVTATGRESEFAGAGRESVTEGEDLGQFLLGLQFRLKAYRGLNVQVLSPVSVKMIGVPADVAYDERIYRVKFETQDLPVDARLVLEIMSPNGQLLSRMHLELL